MSGGRRPKNTPFYVDGKELLCKRCIYRGDYDLFWDKTQSKEVYNGECRKLNKLVTSPLNKCEHFKEKGSSHELSEFENV